MSQTPDTRCHLPPTSPANPTGALVFDQVVISLDGAPLVSLNAQVAPGEVVSVMGPSGVGKSTLLAYAAGFLAPAFDAQGEVRLGDRRVTDLPASARRLGLLFQDALLFPHLSVAGNLAFGMPSSASRRERREAIEEALADIGLAGFGERDPATLSGGQRARVALMRTLLSRPQAMLLDEPFSKLDAALRQEMRDLVFQRIRDHRLPALLVTHDRADAEAAAGPIVELAAATEAPAGAAWQGARRASR